MDTVKPAAGPMRWRRSPAGAPASARMLRWPARNYFAELEPRLKETHPVDDLMARDPDLRRIRRRAHRHLVLLQAKTGSTAVLDFEAERNHLDAARVEAAYNIGFEAGHLAGMVAERGRARGARPLPAELAVLSTIREAVAASPAPRQRVQAMLLEVAWALAIEPPPAASADRAGRGKRHRAGS